MAIYPEFLQYGLDIQDWQSMCQQFFWIFYAAIYSMLSIWAVRSWATKRPAPVCEEMTIILLETISLCLMVPYRDIIQKKKKNKKKQKSYLLRRLKFLLFDRMNTNNSANRKPQCLLLTMAAISPFIIEKRCYHHEMLSIDNSHFLYFRTNPIKRQKSKVEEDVQIYLVKKDHKT